MKIDIYNTREKYGIVYTDPPWEQAKGGKKAVRPNSSGKPLDYPTMNIKDIKELHRIFLLNNTDTKHNVFCWTTEKYLHETEKMFEELGYKLHIRIIYSKSGIGVSPAFTMRYTHEFLLWFYPKGNMLHNSKETRGKYPSVITEKPTKHSRKPRIFRDILIDMFPNSKRIELFAREYSSGFDVWGNEV